MAGPSIELGMSLSLNNVLRIHLTPRVEVSLTYQSRTSSSLNCAAVTY